MLTMFSTPWCGYCHRLKSQLDREGITYEVIDIEQDPTAAEFVMRVNGGNQPVPTMRFGDGSALTTPSLKQVKEKLAALPCPAERPTARNLPVRGRRAARRVVRR